MDLLKDKWIPVRPLAGGLPDWISLPELLTRKEEYQLSLPRDDMELATLQLLISIVQVGWMPDDLQGLIRYGATPMTLETYVDGVEPIKDWFQMEHAEHPFMQVREVKAKDVTPMDKLLAGLTGATNSCFVNEAGMANRLCGGCAAIALFNQASNAPSFGGGFKAGLRGESPITTLVQGGHLRQTLWLNILATDQLPEFMVASRYQAPTWVVPIQEKAIITWASIGLARGLLWQPAHIELESAQTRGQCSCCGREQVALYQGFLKAKFNYTVEGRWPHPHSPRLRIFKTAGTEEKFAAFTTSAPTWTRLTGFVVQQEADKENKEGYEPAAVVLQAKSLLGDRFRERLNLIVGGYRNNKASILERRHELLELNVGWQLDASVIRALVDIGVGFRDALTSSIKYFNDGLKDKKTKKVIHKGVGLELDKHCGTNFYRHSDGLMQAALANANFDDAEQFAKDIQALRGQLKSLCLQLFEQETRPYLNDPQLIHTLAVARCTLYRHLKQLMQME